MLGDVLLVLDQLLADGLLGVGGARAQGRHAVDDVGHEVEGVEVVQHDHVEGRGRGALVQRDPEKAQTLADTRSNGRTVTESGRGDTANRVLKGISSVKA